MKSQGAEDVVFQQDLKGSLQKLIFKIGDVLARPVLNRTDDDLDIFVLFHDFSFLILLVAGPAIRDRMGDHPKTFHPIQTGVNHPVVLCLFRGRGADYKHGFELIQGRSEY